MVRATGPGTVQWAGPRSGDINHCSTDCYWSETTSTATCLLLCWLWPHYSVLLVSGHINHSHHHHHSLWWSVALRQWQWAPPTHPQLLGSLYWRNAHCCSTTFYMFGCLAHREEGEHQAGCQADLHGCIVGFCSFRLVFTCQSVTGAHWGVPLPTTASNTTEMLTTGLLTLDWE